MLYQPRDLSIFGTVILLFIFAPIPIGWITSNLLKVMSFESLFVAAFGLSIVITALYETRKRMVYEYR